MVNTLADVLAARMVKFVGFKLTGFAEDQEGTPGLVLTNDKGKKVVLWVLQDPEGNGPGFLDIEEK